MARRNHGAALGLCLALAVGGAGAAGAEGWPQTEVHSLAGASRYETAVAVSRSGWPGGAAAAVLTAGDDYPDALAAAPLAGAVSAPLLLTPRDRLHPATAAELRRLGAGRVFVVGAVDDAVTAELADSGAGVEVVRGANRYHTAFAVAERAVELGADPDTVLVASGETFADTLAAAGTAAALGHPILLTPRDGGRELLGEQVDALSSTRVVVVGGTAAVPEHAVAGLPGLERVAGSDRSATAAALADRAVDAGLDGPPVLVGGDGFADGLAGGVFAGVARRGPVLVTRRAELSPAVADWLARHRPAAVVKLGGPASVSALATCQLATGQPRAWLCIEGELSAQGYNTGALDGRIDHQSPWAVKAFQKVAGLAVTGQFGEREWQAMLARPTLPPRRPDLAGARHVEVDLTRQLLLLYEGGRMAHAFSVSTGKPSTPTVRGAFSVYRKLDYRNASNMYKPIYFYNRYAIHGYPSVPLHPASAGCVRTYDGDQDFLWPKVHLGDPVAVHH